VHKGALTWISSLDDLCDVSDCHASLQARKTTPLGRFGMFAGPCRPLFIGGLSTMADPKTAAKQVQCADRPPLEPSLRSFPYRQPEEDPP
jgi:hypothetical protein